VSEYLYEKQRPVENSLTLKNSFYNLRKLYITFLLSLSIHQPLGRRHRESIAHRSFWHRLKLFAFYLCQKDVTRRSRAMVPMSFFSSSGSEILRVRSCCRFGRSILKNVFLIIELTSALQTDPSEHLTLTRKLIRSCVFASTFLQQAINVC
jgi:hypothetical protein